MLAFDFKMKELFFDRPAVAERVEQGRLRGLSKAGAYVRTSARSLLRRRKKISAPGSPPSVHSRDAVVTLKNILFAFDPGTQGVVVGPVKLRAKGATPATTVPNVLEFAGQVTVHEQWLGGRWRQVSLKRSGAPERERVVAIGKHPFMHPALAKNAGKFPEFFRDTVK